MSSALARFLTPSAQNTPLGLEKARLFSLTLRQKIAGACCGLKQKPRKL
jgi:hypothetical protein